MSNLSPVLFMTFILSGVLPCCGESSGEKSTLKMRFVFGGRAPVVRNLEIKEPFRTGGPVPDESLLVDGESKGIRNVVVYLTSKLDNSTLSETTEDGATHRLRMSEGRFTPRVLLAQAGDELELVDQGPDLHNANIAFFRNLPRGSVVTPAGEPQVIPLTLSEPAMIPVRCDIHPWMRAYLVILDHRFAAVSDKDGVVSIDALPTETQTLFSCLP